MEDDLGIADMERRAPVDPKTRLTPIKTLCLTAFAVLLATAFLATPSAIAETTALCKSDESPCGTGNGTTSLHETSVGNAKLLTSLGTTECNVLFASTKVGSAGAPQVIEGNFTYTECKLGGSSCTATEENGPAEIKVLREGHEKAKVTAEYLVHFVCGKTLDCSYTGTGLSGTFKGPLLATQKNGEVAISEQSLTKEAGGFLCPKTAKLDITTTPLAATYLSNGGGGGLSSTSTSLSTELSGGGKKGAEITVAEGTKVKDTATLSGENASKAGGTLDYAVYKDKECKELVSEAGKVTVKEGKVPDSGEKELEAGKEYFWQAKYLGDEMNKESTSTCSKEVLKVKASTSLSTLLEGKTEGEELLGLESEEIVLPEGFPAYDSATIGGTNSSTATGKVSFKIYADDECKELIAEEGESSVEKGTALSKEVELEEGIYYWEASYGGDALHQAATSPCGSEILLVVPPVLEWQVVLISRLCLINENPCTLSSYGQGTNFEIQNTSVVKFKYGLVEAVCSEFTLEGSTGVVGRHPTGSITTVTTNNSCSWQGEECLVIPLETPYRFEALRFRGTSGNGLFYLMSTDNEPIKFKIVCGEQTCIYGRVMVDLGLFTGGAPATTEISEFTLLREPGSEASCPTTALLEGGVAGATAPLETKITTPSPLFVTS